MSSTRTATLGYASSILKHGCPAGHRQPTQLMVDIPTSIRRGHHSGFCSNTSGYALDGGGQDFLKSNSRTVALVMRSPCINPQFDESVRLTCTTDLERAWCREVGILASIRGPILLRGNRHELLRQYLTSTSGCCRL